MRPIRFRAWHTIHKRMFVMSDNDWGYFAKWCEARAEWQTKMGDQSYYEVWMQFTGLHDKTELAEIYEGDIIDSNGNLKGNRYESPQIYQEGTDLLITEMGTGAWRDTESIAMGRGCKYTE